LKKGRRKEKVIFAFVYNYCKSQVLHFIFTEGAGHTECRQEYLYETKWKDENLNTLTNMIDVLNQSCQTAHKTLIFAPFTLPFETHSFFPNPYGIRALAQDLHRLSLIAVH